MIIDDPEHRFTVDNYAEAALLAATEENPEVAVTGLKALVENYGSEAVYDACVWWCNAYYEHATGGSAIVPVAVSSVSVLDETTGRLQKTDDETLEPNFKWAAEILMAHNNSDEETFGKLWASLNDVDAVMRGHYVLTLLMTIARSMRGMPYGFALMGYGL